MREQAAQMYEESAPLSGRRALRTLQRVFARPGAYGDRRSLHAGCDAVVRHSGELDPGTYFRLHSFDDQNVKISRFWILNNQAA